MTQAIHSNQLYSETTIFSQGIVADEFTFVAADARRPDGSVEDRSAKAQCIRSCEALRLALDSCGQDLQNLVSLTVFLANYADAPDIIGALHSHLDRSATPAITFVGVSGLEGSCRLRIDAVATPDRIKPILLDDLPLAAGARCHGVRAHDLDQPRAHDRVHGPSAGRACDCDGRTRRLCQSPARDRLRPVPRGRGNAAAQALALCPKEN